MENLSNINFSPKNLTAEITRTRNILKKVFTQMSLGLLITAVTALFVASQRSFLLVLANNPMLFFALFIAQIALVFILSSRIMTLAVQTAVALFYLYSILNGLTLSFIFMAYTASSIAGTFFIAAAMFAGMAFYGSTTKTDLSKLSHYLFMALIGIVIASLVNLFLKSSGLEWIISFIGVILFTVLTAYDTQMIKRWGENSTSDTMTINRISVLGALKLYLDFINLFLFLLRFLGREQ